MMLATGSNVTGGRLLCVASHGLIQLLVPLVAGPRDAGDASARGPGGNKGRRFGVQIPPRLSHGVENTLCYATRKGGEKSLGNFGRDGVDSR